MLRTRILTAAVILPPTCVLLWIGGMPLTVFCLVAMAIAAYEFFTFSKVGTSQMAMQATLCTMLPALSYLCYGFPGVPAGFILGLLLLFAVQVFAIEKSVHQPIFSSSLPASVFGFSYIGVLSLAIVLVALSNAGNILLAWLIGVVAATDTLAYFGGRAIGGAKLSPRISPNKTRSGAICGLIGAVLAAWLLGLWFFPEEEVLKLVLIGLGAGVLGELGDLVESLAKRAYEVKDSGTLLPGHGGVLDRIDAMIFASPMLFFM